MMPRVILPPRGPEENHRLRTSGARPGAVAAVSGAGAEARLRRPRTPALLAAVARLDAGTHAGDPAALAELLAAVAGEFADLELDQQPLGLVAACRLGPPYEVHICDLTGSIVEHFETFRAMPPLYERARSLARHPSYCVIEVYRNVLRAVARDGAVAVLEVKA
jgi:hypothetical protein